MLGTLRPACSPAAPPPLGFSPFCSFFPYNSGLLAREGLSHPFFAVKGTLPQVVHARVPNTLGAAFLPEEEEEERGAEA